MRTTWVSQGDQRIRALEDALVVLLRQRFSSKSTPKPEDWAKLWAAEMEYTEAYRNVLGSKPPVLPSKRKTAFLKRMKERSVVQIAAAA